MKTPEYSLSCNPLTQHIKDNIHNYSTVAMGAFVSMTTNKDAARYAIALTEEEVIVVCGGWVYIVIGTDDYKKATHKECLGDIVKLFNAAPVLFGNVNTNFIVTEIVNDELNITKYDATAAKATIDAYNYVIRKEYTIVDDDEWY